MLGTVTDGHCQESASALCGLQGANAAAQKPICTPAKGPTSHSHPDLHAANTSQASAEADAPQDPQPRAPRTPRTAHRASPAAPRPVGFARAAHRARSRYQAAPAGPGRRPPAVTCPPARLWAQAAGAHAVPGPGRSPRCRPPPPPPHSPGPPPARSGARRGDVTRTRGRDPRPPLRACAARAGHRAAPSPAPSPNTCLCPLPVPLPVPALVDPQPSPPVTGSAPHRAARGLTVIPGPRPCPGAACVQRPAVTAVACPGGSRGQGPRTPRSPPNPRVWIEPGAHPDSMDRAGSPS
ncbi:uncharacterized protein LOC131565547 [Ammospiza caudacuta]|uniref:uncharacterized protein LOC131565547 n=1 Tax=Ammospiza caudacuta TaxID=2857398 RepID=UPI0027381A8F|nr:uncharacterized protein LOC131565547 [Ammospiza caudacuta]